MSLSSRSKEASYIPRRPAFWSILGTHRKNASGFIRNMGGLSAFNLEAPYHFSSILINFIYTERKGRDKMRWIGCLLLIFPLTFWAKCDLTTYRWECSMKPNLKYKDNNILAFCNGTPVYLTRQQYKILKRYERSYVKMVLKVNGEFFKGPCRLASQ